MTILPLRRFKLLSLLYADGFSLATLFAVGLIFLGKERLLMKKSIKQIAAVTMSCSIIAGTFSGCDIFAKSYTMEEIFRTCQHRKNMV